MTQEQIDNLLILDLIHCPDFNSLRVEEFEGKKYWDITFHGKRVEGKPYYEWEGSQSPQSIFRIYKTKDQ